MVGFSRFIPQIRRVARLAAAAAYTQLKEVRRPSKIFTLRTVTGVSLPIYALALFSSTKDDASKLAKEKQELYDAVDKLHQKCKYHDAYALIEPKSAEWKEDAEFLWRLGRALYNHTRETNAKDKAAEKETMRRAFGYIAESLKRNEASSEAHKWYGIVVDQIATYDGTKSRIERSYEAEKHFRRSLELDPQNAGALYSLGVWHFEFAVRWQRRDQHK
jgi:tetratricopeptide (TPR) repeat protein